MRDDIQKFVIIQSADAEQVQDAVSRHLNAGFKLHGKLLITTVNDPLSPTVARLVYIQAMVRYGIPVYG